MTPKVCLVMVVKDEAPIISERLKAVHDEIDGWCIVDTGSTDDTPAIVMEVLGDLPGTLHHRAWTGFADGRTHAVERATQWAQDRGDDWWALLLDADTIAHFTPGWRRVLRGEVVDCEVHHGALRYNHPRLLHLSGHPWKWRGVLHEFLEVPGDVRHGHAGDWLHVEHGHGGARERNPNKFRDDAELLARIRAENAEPDLDARYLFYEAQSWRDCGEIDRAIERYTERGRMGGWIGEVFIAWLRAGELLWAKENWPGAVAMWTAAWAADPSRAEAIIGLSSLMRVRNFWVPCYEYGRLAQRAAKQPVHGLFGDVNIAWRADYEVAIAGSWVGTPSSKEAGRKACLRLINLPMTPEPVRAAMQQNLEQFYPAKGKR